MSSQKFLIFDAGPIISLSMNGLLDILENLKKEFRGEFILTPSVKKELVDNPLKIKKFELEAIRIKNLLDRKVLKLSSEFVKDNLLEKETRKVMEEINSSFLAYEKINLIHEGEASCIAFSNLCRCENLIVIDERTTRILTEAPDNLKAIMERKLHTKIRVKYNNLKNLSKIRYIRSPEIVYIAYKKNLINLKSPLLLDALLYSLKYKGASISSKEIEIMKQRV